MSLGVLPRPQYLGPKEHRLLAQYIPKSFQLSVHKVRPIAVAPQRSPILSQCVAPETIHIKGTPPVVPPRPVFTTQRLSSVTLEPETSALTSPQAVELPSLQRVSPTRRKWEPPEDAFISLKPALTGLQQRLLSGAESASTELLKRKPTASELAAVAVAGAERGRRLQPAGSSAARLSASQTIKTESELGE